MQIEEFMQKLAEFEAVKAAYLRLADEGISKEMAKVLLVNRLKVTYGAASDLVELCETVTGRKLEELKGGDHE